MKNLATFCLAALISASFGFSQDQLSAPESGPLILVQEILLTNVLGRIDHFTFDAKGKRVILAALGNNSVEVVDTFSSREFAALPVPRHLKAWSLQASSTSSL